MLSIDSAEVIVGVPLVYSIILSIFPLLIMTEPATPTQDTSNQVLAQSAMDPASISRLGVHLPKFEPTDPELWFAIADRSFEAANVTSERCKFCHAAAHLGMTHTSEVKDLILNPPQHNPYSSLKEELIRRLGTSQAAKTKKLLEHEVMGDQKPSQFLRRLKDLGGQTVGDGLIKTIWMSRLPTLAQAILASHQSIDLQNLANLADSIVETSTVSQLNVAALSPSPSNEDILTQKVMQQQLQIELLQQEIASIKLSSRPPNANSSRTSSRSRPRFRSRTPKRDRSQPPLSGICWYHWRFGSNATKCIKPCSFQADEKN